MVEAAGGDVVPVPTDQCRELPLALDGIVDRDQDLGRFLSQITPLGRDRALAESRGVRVMTMIDSKGLTVRATVLAGLDDGIVPRSDADLNEERRLLYVAMTRAKEYLFCTWAGRRSGPTARRRSEWQATTGGTVTSFKVGQSDRRMGRHISGDGVLARRIDETHSIERSLKNGGGCAYFGQILL